MGLLDGLSQRESYSFILTIRNVNLKVPLQAIFPIERFILTIRNVNFIALNIFIISLKVLY